MSALKDVKISLKPSTYTVEKFLGVQAEDNLNLAEKVKVGFSFDALERLVEVTGLPLEQLRLAVRISARTLTRRKKENKFSPEESDRLVSISLLIAQTFELFEGDEIAGLQWFTNPNRALGGLTPIEVAATETGTREVENLIGRLENGVFS